MQATIRTEAIIRVRVVVATAITQPMTRHQAVASIV